MRIIDFGVCYFEIQKHVSDWKSPKKKEEKCDFRKEGIPLDGANGGLDNSIGMTIKL